MEQVLTNLIVNARDAMPDGGKLTIQTSNITLGEEYAALRPGSNAGEHVMLVVRDTGVGMSDDVQARIFEPFFTTKDVGRGTGLGLSTCYGIVAQAGGHIAIDSELGRGTNVAVYLPRVHEDASPAPQLVESGHVATGQETILLVEDEPSVRDVAAVILRGLGYTVLGSANGHEALRVARERSAENIHLLLTDLVMPLMGGRELADQLRELHPETRVLYTSAYVEDTDEDPGGVTPDAAFLQKPFTPVVLGRKVREVLEK
jgi:CheY-like chemotaxis protein